MTLGSDFDSTYPTTQKSDNSCMIMYNSFAQFLKKAFPLDESFLVILCGAGIGVAVIILFVV